MENLYIPVLKDGGKRDEMGWARQIISVAPDDAVAFFHGPSSGWFARPDLEKLRDWISRRLEETKPKPQPGEVWRSMGYLPQEFVVGSDDAGARNIHTGSRVELEWLRVTCRRVGRIVYDDQP